MKEKIEIIMGIPTEVKEIVCPNCGAVIGTVSVTDPHAGEMERIFFASHQCDEKTSFKKLTI